MLELFFAVAFSAVPLTLYIPPVRSLSLFAGSFQQLLRHITVYVLHICPRLRLAFSRIFTPILRSQFRARLLIEFGNLTKTHSVILYHSVEADLSDL
ncbi:hypothetical protein HanPI659440_Chr01g0011131 [Helianthus annuus]|nr:hypothetical protein HanPI659440_Chr01g0011131 [Helianthus annuus]